MYIQLSGRKTNKRAKRDGETYEANRVKTFEPRGGRGEGRGGKTVATVAAAAADRRNLRDAG